MYRYIFSLSDKCFEQEDNKEQVMLRKVTEMLVSSHDNLFDFGLHLGFTYEQIEQRRTNCPFSVQIAALGLACQYWDRRPETVLEKQRKILSCCKELKKLHLKAKIKDILLTAAELTTGSELINKSTSKAMHHV